MVNIVELEAEEVKPAPDQTQGASEKKPASTGAQPAEKKPASTGAQPAEKKPATTGAQPAEKKPASTGAQPADKKPASTGAQPAEKKPATTGAQPAEKKPATTGAQPAEKKPASTGAQPADKKPASTGAQPAEKKPASTGAQPAEKKPASTGAQPADKKPASTGAQPADKKPASTGAQPADKKPASTGAQPAAKANQETLIPDKEKSTTMTKNDAKKSTPVTGLEEKKDGTMKADKEDEPGESMMDSGPVEDLVTDGVPFEQEIVVQDFEEILRGPIRQLTPDQMEEARKIKEEGNNYFKGGYYVEAISCYTKALKLNPRGGSETAVYLKNRAACLLKLDKFDKAAKDCSAALEITPNDPKALFRRCQALEAMERYEEAYKDGAMLFKLDPKNSAIQPILRRLGPIIQKRVEENSKTNNKVTQMLDLTFKKENADAEKRKQAANNLIVLAREEAGADSLFKTGGVENLIALLDDEDAEMRLIAIRALAALASNNQLRAVGVLEKVTIEKIMKLMSVNLEEQSAAAANLIRNIILGMTNIEHYQAEKDKHEERRKDVSLKLRPYPFIATKISEDRAEMMPYIDKIFEAFILMLPQAKVSKFGRDNAMELIIKFVARQTGVGQNLMFISRGGLQALLEVGGTIAEHKTIPVSENTRLHASLALAKIWEDLFQETEQNQFREACDAYFNDMFGDNIMESKLEAIMALAALLQGPYEVGNYILGRTGVLEMILAMADSDNAMHVKYAVEALVQSANKKDRCAGVIKQATPILKELYTSKNDHVKVRALVGLCKLGSHGGSDVSAKTYAEGSTQTLAKACRKFLKNPAKDADLRKWAGEGLAYLSLDADVKEEFVDDTEAVKSLMELSKMSDKGVVYPVAQIFVNVTNSYDKKEPDPELVELAKFAKHHVPQEHAKDKEPFIGERIKKLVKEGLVNSLTVMAKSSMESNNTKELLSRVYAAVSMEQEHRGMLVQSGAAKLLINFANEGTGPGKTKAAQTLARIAITTNPEIAFPGQRACEVVRPLVLLLDVEKAALENYEALLALTNLASMNDTVRKRILKEEGFSKAEFYAYEEHEQLKRAALECICNLLMYDDTIRYFRGNNDRVKYFVLMSNCEDMEDEEDYAIIRATTGALAIMSFSNEEICGKITTVTAQWVDILSKLIASNLPELSHRGAHIVMNIVASNKEIAGRVAATQLLELLMAVARTTEPERAQARDCCERALDSLEGWGIVQLTEDGKSWRKSVKSKKKDVVEQDKQDNTEIKQELDNTEKKQEQDNTEKKQEQDKRQKAKDNETEEKAKPETKESSKPEDSKEQIKSNKEEEKNSEKEEDLLSEVKVFETKKEEQKRKKEETISTESGKTADVLSSEEVCEDSKTNSQSVPISSEKET